MRICIFELSCTMNCPNIAYVYSAQHRRQTVWFVFFFFFVPVPKIPKARAQLVPLNLRTRGTFVRKTNRQTQQVRDRNGGDDDEECIPQYKYAQIAVHSFVPFRCAHRCTDLETTDYNLTSSVRPVPIHVRWQVQPYMRGRFLLLDTVSEVEVRNSHLLRTASAFTIPLDHKLLCNFPIAQPMHFASRSPSSNSGEWLRHRNLPEHLLMEAQLIFGIMFLLRRILIFCLAFSSKINIG